MNPATGFVTQLGIDLESQIDVAASEPVDYVEILLDGPTRYERFRAGTQSVDIGSTADASGRPDGDAGLDTAAAVRERLDAADLGAVVHLPFPTDIGSPYRGVRNGAVATQKQCLETAASMGAEKAVLHPESSAWGVAWPDPEVRPHIDQSVDELTAFAAERGIEVCVENLFESHYTVETIDDLLAATDASMTLDTGHARVSGFDAEETAAFVADHADRVSHVHLNDTRRPSDEHLPFGAGTVDFETILGAFPADWSGTLSLEVGTDSLDYLRTSVDRLDALLSALPNASD